MLFETPLEAVVSSEPWRQRVGYPNSVTDPTWTASGHILCDGDVEHEDGTKYWVCRKCGYIGWATTQHHYPVLGPKEYFEQAYQLFLRQAADVDAVDRAHFIMGAALRAAVGKSPQEVRALVEKVSCL